MNVFIILLISIIIHEFGHWLFFRIWGHKPSISFRWYGILVGENIMRHVKVIELFFATLAGVVFGFAFLYPFHLASEYILLYFLMCSIDITIILQIFEVKKEDMGMNFLLYQKKLIEKEISGGL